MEIEVGSILPGKVTGITKFGAFVQLAPGKSGLVHISEIANSFVNDVNDFLTLGQEVQVKVINIDASGRLNLSIKQALPQSAPERRPRPAPVPARGGPANVRPNIAPAPRNVRLVEPQGEVLLPSKDTDFESKLKKFMQDSDSKMSGVKIYTENRRGSRRRK